MCLNFKAVTKVKIEAGSQHPYHSHQPGKWRLPQRILTLAAVRLSFLIDMQIYGILLAGFNDKCHDVLTQTDASSFLHSSPSSPSFYSISSLCFPPRFSSSKCHNSSFGHNYIYPSCAGSLQSSNFLFFILSISLFFPFFCSRLSHVSAF